MSLMFVCKWVDEPYGQAYFDIYADSGQLLAATHTFKKRYIGQRAGEQIVAQCRSGNLEWSMIAEESHRHRAIIFGATGQEAATTTAFETESEVRQAINTLIRDATVADAIFVM
jgi:hypothetical protein